MSDQLEWFLVSPFQRGPDLGWRYVLILIGDSLSISFGVVEIFWAWFREVRCCKDQRSKDLVFFWIYLEIDFRDFQDQLVFNHLFFSLFRVWLVRVLLYLADLWVITRSHCRDSVSVRYDGFEEQRLFKWVVLFPTPNHLFSEVSLSLLTFRFQFRVFCFAFSMSQSGFVSK